MFKKLFFLFCFLLLLNSVKSQIRCVSVLPNGNVTLTWSIATSFPGAFNSYHIFSSTAKNGPYVVIDSIFNINQFTYTHTTVNATTAPVYYYVQTRSNSSGLIYNAAQDTVSSIKLKVTNPANGTAVLSWNPIAIPAISTSSGMYHIYLEYPSGNWSLLDSTTDTKYIDTINVCNASLNYRIEIKDASGCTSVSSIDGGFFKNTIVPSIPVFDTLSVDDTNHALMSWNINPSSDVKAYVIYQFNGATWVPIDTVDGINNVSYTYLSSNPDAGSEQYRLAAFDTCGNISPLGTVKSSIYLTITPDICSRSAILNWTDYGSIGTGLGGYRIYKSTGSISGPYTLSGSVAAGTLTYTESGLLPNTTYYYKVEAFDNSTTKTASSNRFKFFSAAPIPPVFTYLRKATVSATNRIDITCHVDIAASSKAYKIMKSTTGNTGSFTLIGTIPATGVTPILFTDTKVATDKYSYFYKMINVDSCGYEGLETNVGHTILLNAASNSDELTNTLTWNDYEQWLGNVVSYHIYRGIDGVFNSTPIVTIPYSGVGMNTFIDDVSAETSGEGVFYYYIEAVEGIGNPYGFTDHSLSNIAKAYQNPRIFIPNAFKLSGINRVFIPVTTYVDIKNYEFLIFDRWGKNIFKTNSVDEGWDGMYGGNKSEGGVYVYLLKIKTSKGDYVERKGTVTLIR